ncbi:hypothetical protein RJ640_010872 [Escallonia rubra]|uniref:Peptidase A1 domain-containing protein n=1 Tax=Escallonia rubra TaxID=112253 RepID=A0AA88USC0_9ASTE|nr:hypothetical protein RJ640_010872 [Escallonia rubra]
MEPDESPQLKGVVIITLPPADNPSLGKTITAFTLSDSTQTPPNQTHQAPQQQSQLPIQSPSNPQRHFSWRRTLIGTPRNVLRLVGISLIVLILWGSVSTSTRYELRNSDDDEKPNSFIFPLFPKLGSNASQLSQRDVELKLGRFVDVKRENVLSLLDDGARPRKVAKSVAMASAAESSSVFTVKGNIYPDGLYYTYMLVGSPPRPYFLDMDTGSDLTWIQCDAPCASCAKGAHPFYKPPKSNIIPSKDLLCVEVQRTGYCEACHQCDYEIEYADHSSSMGVLARDELHLTVANGSLSKLNVVFGCAYDQQGLLLNSLAKTDGILGLSRAKVSLPSQLASQGMISNVIGHCLATEIGGGGYMFLGDDYVPLSQMAWAPMLNSPLNSYTLGIEKMTYGSKQLTFQSQNTGAGRVFFDSGSSYTYFTRQAYSDLVAALKGVHGDGLVQDASDTSLPICWGAKFPIRSVKEVEKFFKPLTLQFGKKWWIASTNLQIFPEGYLIISNKGNVCLGILDGSKVLDGSTVVLGDISLRGRLVVYDNVHQKIGWMQSDCAKPRRFKSLSLF